MVKKSSTTKPTPSSSKAKAPVKKKTAVKSLPKSGKTDIPFEWTVYWVRTNNGEEYVSAGRIMSDGILMVDPTLLSYLSGTLVLAPYGMMAQPNEDGSRAFFIGAENILHVNEAADNMITLYQLSLITSLDYVEKHFNLLVDKSQLTLTTTLAQSMNEAGPTMSELDELEKVLKETGAYDWDVPQPERSKSQTVDDLVKLAESKGKGKTQKSG